MANREQLPTPRDGKRLNPTTTSPDDDEAQLEDVTRATADEDLDDVRLAAEEDADEDLEDEDDEVDDEVDDEADEEVDVDDSEDDESGTNAPRM